MAKNRKRIVVQQKSARNRTRRSKTSRQEVGLLGQALRALGSSAGGAVGGMFGNPLAGAGAGHSLGAAVSRWLGSGDYRVSQNSITQSVKASGSIPAMHSTGQSVVVRHKEFVMTVLGSQNFNVQRSMPINPGRAEVFPWLSRLANCYQEYRIRGLVFHYVPTSGNLSGGGTPSLGSVMLQTSYRATDSSPSSKMEMLNEYWSTEVVPCDTTCHPLECNPDENPFNIQYVRSDTAVLPSTDSPLLYDLATTHVATEGQSTDGAALGDLWVTYEIELKKPILSSNVTSSIAGFGWMEYVQTPIQGDNLFAGTAFTTGVPYTLPWTTGQLNDVIIPANWAGTAHFVINIVGPVEFPRMTGPPVAVGEGDVVNWSLTQDRYEFQAQVGDIIPNFSYCFAVVKLVVGQPLRVVVPTVIIDGGAIVKVQVTAFARQNVM